MGDNAGSLKYLKAIVLLALKYEKGTAGRVNLIFTFFVGLAGITRGELFTIYGVTIIAFIILSAVINQLIPVYARRRW